jgi:membrane protease YdiL (CAAX protease family)
MNPFLTLPLAWPAWAPSDTLVVLPFACCLFGYLSFWWAYYSESVAQWFVKMIGGDRGKVFRMAALKLWGAICMGVLPATCMLCFTEFSLRDLGCFWTLDAPSDVWLLWGILIGCSLFLSTAFGKQVAKNYPQIRARHWSWATMLISAGGWFLYLSASEFMFRGYLLFPLAQEWGFWPAAATSTLLYSLTHFHKGKEEVLLCLPVGILTCYWAYETGSFVLPFLGHLLVAWYNTAYRVLRNEDMTWAGGWSLEAPSSLGDPGAMRSTGVTS